MLQVVQVVIDDSAALLHLLAWNKLHLDHSY